MFQIAQTRPMKIILVKNMDIHEFNLNSSVQTTSLKSSRLEMSILRRHYLSMDKTLMIHMTNKLKTRLHMIIIKMGMRSSLFVIIFIK